MITKTSDVEVSNSESVGAAGEAIRKAPVYANAGLDKTVPQSYSHVAWKSLDSTWYAATHHSTRQPVTFIGSPTQLNTTTGNGIIAIGKISVYDELEFTRLYGRPAGYKLFNEGYGKFVVQFTNSTFQDAFSVGQVPTVVACPHNSNPKGAASLRPSDVVFGNGTGDIDYNAKSVSLRVRTLRFATNDGPSQLLTEPATMVGDSRLGFSLLAFYGTESPNIRHAVINAEGLVVSGDFEGVTVTRLGTGTYVFDHPFGDTPACITTLHASADSTDRSSCAPQVSTAAKQILVYCVNQGQYHGGSSNTLSLVDAKFSIVIMGVQEPTSDTVKPYLEPFNQTANTPRGPF